MPIEDELLEEQEDDTPVLKLLRQQLKESRGAAKEAASSKRELAFLKAGVDTETKAGKLLLKAYDGDLSDVEALKAEAAELNCLRGPPQPTGTELPQTQDPTQSVNLETGSGARQELAGGASVDPNARKPVAQEAREAYDAAMKAQKSEEDAGADWLNVKVTRRAQELGLTPSDV
jgi:hypothetical protein